LDEIGSSAWLEVDGGISVHTISQVRKAGADVFVAASAIFGYPDGIAAGIQALRNKIKPDPYHKTKITAKAVTLSQ
jgi:ribulose-phosphate 3-epimerase